MSKKDSTPLINVTIPKPRKQQIGISYLQVNHSAFGLKRLAQAETEHHDAYDILERFLSEVNDLASLNDLLQQYGSHKYGKNTDKFSKAILSMMKEKYSGVDCSELMHIHCKRGGKGAFVLHGFTHDNCFEIVLFDPDHELHS